MAHTYGPEIVKLERNHRIIWALGTIQTIKENLVVDREEHKNECEECQNGDLCLEALSISPEQRRRLDLISRLKGMIYRERQDQEYADRAKLYGVEYRHHVDGFCAYWQNLRHRKFVIVNFACELCSSTAKPLECHHLHYDTLGFEELADVQALCRDCHAGADRVRTYYAGLATYASKKYGEYWQEQPIECVEEEFDRWLEKKNG
jgi:hypothetical protein